MEANRKKVQVHMLPSGRVMLPSGREKSMEYLWNRGPIVESKELKYKGMYELQYLYFTSDEEIKEGDNMIASGRLAVCAEVCDFTAAPGTISYVLLDDNLSAGFDIGKCRKIIASTDPKLLIDTGTFEPDGTPTMIRISQPSQAFLEKYVEKGGIDEVWVDYETNNIHGQEVMFHEENNEHFFEDRLGDVWCSYITLKETIKVNSHNEIAIHEVVEKTYTREELEQHLFNLAEHYGATAGKADIDDFNKWIKENL